MTSPRKRPVRATPPSKTPPEAPVTVIRPNPVAWQAALHLADGNPRRLSVQPDGSVMVDQQKISS
jgi:hypothetical protein